ncbi:unnamed protein product [Trifolium pratense]|uniref:Uncharacterized protein n=1 Tax=Trifolium pratense TaxID=57577 RepID=A0ACB0KLA0_TRIPR|nr:unnamed protein product [Trifolium pratense]
MVTKPVPGSQGEHGVIGSASRIPLNDIANGNGKYTVHNGTFIHCARCSLRASFRRNVESIKPRHIAFQGSTTACLMRKILQLTKATFRADSDLELKLKNIIIQQLDMLLVMFLDLLSNALLRQAHTLTTQVYCRREVLMVALRKGTMICTGYFLCLMAYQTVLSWLTMSNDSVPNSGWHCLNCNDNTGDGRRARPIMIRLTRVDKEPEYEMGGCVVCSPNWLLKQELSEIVKSINQIGSLIPGIEKALNDKLSTSNLKNKALMYSTLISRREGVKGTSYLDFCSGFNHMLDTLNNSSVKLLQHMALQRICLDHALQDSVQGWHP